MRHLSLTSKVMFAEQVTLEFWIVERAIIAQNCVARSPTPSLKKSDN